MQGLNLMAKAGQVVNSVKAKVPVSVVQNAPYIGVVVGVIGMTGAAVWACKKTLELPEIIEETKKELQEVRETIPEEKKGERTKALTVTYGHAALEVTKLYAGPLIIGGFAIGAITAGTVTLRNRNAALTATVGTLEAMYSRYRKNVIERYGADVDTEMMYSIKEETVVDEKTGKKRKVKLMDKEIADGEKSYARIWEKGATTYFTENCPDYDLIVIGQVLKRVNEILTDRRYVFLNEVYEMLGFPPSEAGRNVGWIYDPEHRVVPEDYVGDNQILFNIDRKTNPTIDEYVHGFQPYMLLDFNVDGDISKDGLYLKVFNYFH